MYCITWCLFETQLEFYFYSSVGPSYERYEEMVKLFSSMLLHKVFFVAIAGHVILSGIHLHLSDSFSLQGRIRGTDESKSREIHDDVHSPPAALAVWKSAAHVARTTAAVLANERKPLFCAMNTRQVNL